jgi:hypothetical protein
LIFVDGVRRIDARLIVRRQEGLCHGAFGSHAAGAVKVVDLAAVCEAPRIGGIIVIGSGESSDCVCPRERLELLARLSPGERTPLFALTTSPQRADSCEYSRAQSPELGSQDERPIECC